MKGWKSPPGLALVVLAVLTAGCATEVQDRVRAYNDDGVYLYQRGQYTDARDSFRAALSLAPEDPAVLFNLADCYAHLNDFGQAEGYYRECLVRAPEQNECRYGLAVMLYRQGRRSEAAQMVDQWMVGQPRLALAYAADGWLWHQTGDLPRAQARLQQALELDPHEPHALTEMGTVFEEMHRPDRAVVLYEQALEQNPRQPEVAGRLNALLASGAGRPRPD